MSTIILRPIQHGFPNDNGCSQLEMWEVQPDHVASLLRTEYRWLRRHGVIPEVARWHVHRMLAMIHNAFKWTANFIPEDFMCEDPDPFDAEDFASSDDES